MSNVQAIAHRLDHLPLGGCLGVSSYYWGLLAKTGFGWAMDSMDTFLFTYLGTNGWKIDIKNADGSALDGSQLGLLGSAAFAGSLVGALAFGQLADLYGRKPMFMLTLLIFMVATLVCGAANSYALLLAFRFIGGIGLGGELPVASTLVQELAPAPVRGRIIVLLESCWSIGCMLAVLLAFELSKIVSWRTVFYLSAIAMIYAIAVRFIVPESPKWLASVGRIHEAREITCRIERAHGIIPAKANEAVPPMPVAGFDAYDLSSLSPLERVALMFRGEFLSRTIVLWIVWWCLSFSYYAVYIWLPDLRAKEPNGFSLNGSTGTMFFIIFWQFPGYISAAYFVEAIGRKTTLAVYLVGACVSAIAFGYVENTQINLMATGAFMSWFMLGAWGSLYAYTPENYPTPIRAMGASYPSAFSRIGAIVGPYVIPVLLQDDYSSDTVMLLCAGVLLVATAVLLVFGYEPRGRNVESAPCVESFVASFLPMLAARAVFAIVLLCVASALQLNFPEHDAVDAAVHLVARRLGPQYVEQITFSTIPPTAAGNDVAEVSSTGNKVHIAGSSGTALSFGLQWYLKNVVHTQTDWEDHQLRLPPVLPLVPALHRLEKASKYTYYLNVCTVSYSSWTWGWDKWEKHIDWMALNGINMPLAFTGQEKVWQATFRHFNVSDAGLHKFFAGAAFLAWGRMGNLRGSWVKGPLPQAFIDTQFDLQLRILARMREYGMLPALPAFAGHIPEEIASVYANATITRSPNWGNFPDEFCCVYMLDPTDPLYLAIGKTFVAEQRRLYGYTSSLYQADTYNEMDPAQSDVEYLRKASKAVIESMTAADPHAVWLMQGWLFLSDYWTNDRIEAYVGGVPDDKMLILDLYSEVVPIWRKTLNYFGKPWIYCVLHNFGGNLGLRGDLPTIATDPIAARKASNGTMVGIGLTMEGIFQNYIVYDLALSMAWETAPVAVPTYVADFIHARYHSTDAHTQRAWQRLAGSVYNVTRGYGGVTKSIVTRRPHWHLDTSTFMPSNISYDASEVILAWRDLLHAASTSPELATTDAFLHDVVDVTRQALSDAILLEYKSLRFRFHAHRIPSEQIYAITRRILAMIQELELILASHADFLLGRWLFDAKALAGNDTTLSLYYEYEARNQVTRWGDANSNTLGDYATKQWAGLVGSYYLVRWRIWLTEVTAAYDAGRTVNEKATKAAMEAFELGWQTETISYPIASHGNPLEISRRILHEYFGDVPVYDGAVDFLPTM
ncbi:alpha-N-acetylglucosaminidase (NAGLU) [Achlya hypogyna]|uniref:Alpha-N-acetylglucosaminidase (NAGLU) n=1 Tax=Achlya hypogyna TaxID=1202772 RepID=A0A1V9Z8R3_ACHHY|nr:alpha-N-acetylglucosaminidase (NAGLU) [Achlya hypogyna]